MEVCKSPLTTMEGCLTFVDTYKISCCSCFDRPYYTIMEGYQRVYKSDVQVCIHRCCIEETFQGVQSVLTLFLRSYYCFGPSKSPVDMTINEMVSWNRHLQTPVLFNHHEPYEVNSSTIQRVDLNPIHSTTRAISNQERVLILTPLRDAAEYLITYFDLLSELTYPHDLIDLAFLVGDSTDDTLAVLSSELNRIQQRSDKIPFHSATIIEKDFGNILDMKVEERHGFAAQGPRRKAIGKARNYLLYTALRPEHSWVYWRDVDIKDSPRKILEDFMAHDKDILVPSTYMSLLTLLTLLMLWTDIWFHRYENNRDIEGRFDYNSWVESDKGRRLTATLDKDVILAEGYKEYDTGRTYMARMGDWRNNKDEEIELDGIGGVNILVKADVHRSGKINSGFVLSGRFADQFV